MKKFIFVALLSFPLYADIITDELTNLDNLIDVTRQNLQNELELKKLIESFGDLQKQSQKNKDDKELFLKLVHLSQKIEHKIEESCLAQTFSPEFLEEIHQLSQIGSKHGVS